MNFDEIIAELKKFEGTDEYNAFAGGLLNDTNVGAYLDSDNGKKLMQPKLDKHFSTSLETWKTNNLDGLVSAKVKELYPETDEKDTEIAKLKAKMAEMEAANIRATLLNLAQTIAAEKKLPNDVIALLVGADEKTTKANIEKFETSYNSAIAAAVDEKLKGANYVPPVTEDENVDGVSAAFAKLNPGLKF